MTLQGFAFSQCDFASQFGRLTAVYHIREEIRQEVWLSPIRNGGGDDRVVVNLLIHRRNVVEVWFGDETLVAVITDEADGDVRPPKTERDVCHSPRQSDAELDATACPARRPVIVEGLE